MDKKLTQEDINGVKKLGNMFTEEELLDEARIQRAALTSQDLDATDPTKMYGNVPKLLDTIKDVSKDLRTPMLGLLESKEVMQVNTFNFEMMTEALEAANRDNFKTGENLPVYDPTHVYDRKQNKIMMVGVGVKYSMLVEILAQNPRPQDIIRRRLENNLKVLSIAKEDFLFNGDKTLVNETDGILTILQREALLNNTATSLTLSGPTGSRILPRDTLEDLIFSAVHDNGGDPSSMILMACQLAQKTIRKWFNDEITFIQEGPFNVMGRAPVYLSLTGNMIPMFYFNENRVSNVNDTVLLLDMNELSLVRLFQPLTKDMPIQYPMDKGNMAVLDSMGLNFLHTLTSGYINGIDKA